MHIRSNLENLPQIAGTQPQGGAEATRARTNTQSNPYDTTLATDNAHVSSAASQVAQSAGATLLNSDVRADKVASIQSALKSGTYSVPASAVAQKVIDSLIATEK